MSSIDIDPTFVLKYLNDLGYRNITAEQLREFVRDLKKLIKYDKSKEQSEYQKEKIDKYFVYMKETESSRAKRSHSTNTQTSTGAPDDRTLRTNTRTNEYSKSNSALDKTAANSDTNQTSAEAINRENIENHVPRSRMRISEPKDVMWIRQKSATRTKKSDPVSLYQAYQNDWNRFKNQIPIDNKHQDLRWNIRKKTMG